MRPHRHLKWSLQTKSGCLLEVSAEDDPIRKFRRPEFALTRENHLTLSAEDNDFGGPLGDCRYADVLETGDIYVVTSLLLLYLHSVTLAHALSQQDTLFYVCLSHIVVTART